MSPDEALQSLLKSRNGVKKVAASMINPIRLALKELYRKDLTKNQEAIVEASVEEMCARPTTYKELVKLKDKLVSEFR